jgi:manganese transport protein
MFIAMILTGIATYLILMLDRFGFRPLEKFISAFVIIIALCYVVETFFSKPQFSQIVSHGVVPWMGSSGAVLLAVGVIGATVMPHAVYLHSGLTQNRVVPRDDNEKRRIGRFNTRKSSLR